MRKGMSRGICAICSKEFSKSQMTRHVAACVQGKQSAETCLHLTVQGLHAKHYWLHLATQPSAKLADLDNYLRHIWLECCGHLSAFEIDGEQYLPHAAEGEGSTMRVPLKSVLYQGVKFTHTYDFGTSTELSLSLVGTLSFTLGKRSVGLLARNLAPAFLCVECGRPATQLCTECAWQAEAWLCDDCSGKHECGEEMLLPIVNSPRMGQCGYTG